MFLNCCSVTLVVRLFFSEVVFIDVLFQLLDAEVLVVLPSFSKVEVV